MATPLWIERCRACGVAFALRPGEGTSALVHRYTAWREEHRDCTLPEPEPEPPRPGPVTD
jgi:hypothetical protein